MKEADVDDVVGDLLEQMPCSVVLPAGYGKTELLSNIAIRASSKQGVLILTHTNAGVSVLRGRLYRKNAKGDISVTTISSFAERIVHSYPEICAYEAEADSVEDYQAKHQCSSRFLRSDIGRRIVKSSWSHVLVDEYQDCSLSQHDMILALSEVLPVLVVGDPLQGIFDFQSESVVDWDSLPSEFPLVTVNSAPRRWETTNPGLGADLERLRQQIIDRSPIDVRTFSNINFAEYDRRFVSRLSRTTHELPGQSVIIHPGMTQQQSVNLARGMKNRFTAIEQRSMQSLRELCSDLESAEGDDTVGLVLDAAQRGLANIGPGKDKLSKIAAGQRPVTRETAAAFGIASAGIRCAEDPRPRSISDLVEAILAFEGITNPRRQFWSDLLEVLRIADRSGVSLLDAFEGLRSKRQRSFLQRSDDIVARPLMVKGLEFANVLILEGGRFGTRELYVAATRACTSLVVAAKSPILRPWDVDRSKNRDAKSETKQGRLLLFATDGVKRTSNAPS